MSLKRSVVCIAGNIAEDIYAPASWTDSSGALDRKRIESWFEGKAAKIVWETMDKSVTHLVISRAAFKTNHEAVKFVRKDRRGKKKAKIVTYDWLEDSLADNKAIQDVSAYDPGKPRDVPAILAARRMDSNIDKDPKTTKSKSAKGTSADEAAAEADPEEKEGPTKRREPEAETLTTSPDSGTSQSDTEEKLRSAPVADENKAISDKKGVSDKKTVSDRSNASDRTITKPGPPKSGPSMSGPSKSSASKPLPVRSNALPPPRPGTQVAVQKLALPKQHSTVTWKLEAKAKLYLDKVDQFPYNITLKHKDKKGEFWHLTIWESTSDAVTKSFSFCANRYAENKPQPIQTEVREPVPSSQMALKYLADSFRMKMSYDWDERLVRAGGAQPGNWRYALRADRKTGKVPPEYTPGNPKCKKLEDLAPIRVDKKQKGAQISVGWKPAHSIRPNGERDTRVVLNRVTKMVPSPSDRVKPLNQAKAKQGKARGSMDSGVYQSKARKLGALPTSLKRKAAEAPAGPGRYSKVSKAGSSNFKSEEFIVDSDPDEDLPAPPQSKSRPSSG